MTPEFLVTSLVICASPGTGALYTIAAGLSGGVRASVIAAVGCTLGILPHTLAAISGLAALLHTSALAFQLIKYLGVAYLLYMAWTIFHDKETLSINNLAGRKSDGTIIVSAIVVNLLNPKLSIFFFAFLPQFVGPTEPAPIITMLELSIVFMIMTLVIFILYGVFAAILRRHVISSVTVQNWMRRGFAAGFAGLAVQLGVSSK